METVSVLLNHTDHEPLDIWVGDQIALSLPSVGPTVRCKETSTPRGHITVAEVDVPLCVVGYGEVEHLPPARAGTVYIVSQLVVRACPDRRDLFFPTDLVRDATGRIIGCRALARLA